MIDHNDRTEADDPALDDGQVVEPWDDPRYTGDGYVSDTVIQTADLPGESHLAQGLRLQREIEEQTADNFPRTTDVLVSSTGTAGSAGVQPANPPSLYGIPEAIMDVAGPEDDWRQPRPQPQAQVIVLDALQEKAITDCRDHLYTNISGTAGVGKTFVAREIVRRQPGTLLCATTGIASVNLGEGTTINSALRYFDTASLKDSYTNGHLQAVIRKLRRSGVTRLLIDEKSMMAGAQLTYITRAVREVNEGGIYALESVGAGEDGDDSGSQRSQQDLPPIGITLVGDFGQLPPVPDEDPKTGKKLPVEFCFDSKEWPAFAEHTTRLETIYRQDAKDFVAALHAVRRGDVATALAFFTADRFSATMDDSFTGATIFAKNDAVDRHNLLMLDKLPGTAMVATAIRKGKQRGDWKLVPDELRLKEGALVMILANRRIYDDDDDDRGQMIYANGDLGELVGKQGTGWMVRLQRTGGVVPVLPVRRENTVPLEVGRRKELVELLRAGRAPFGAVSIEELITEKGKGKSEIIGTIDYMPLRAAYGCTVHKTQGLTLDQVQVNLRDPFFRQPGMLFVALSRARTAGGLRIVGDQRGFVERCRIEPRVQAWL